MERTRQFEHRMIIMFQSVRMDSKSNVFTDHVAVIVLITICYRGMMQERSVKRLEQKS